AVGYAGLIDVPAVDVHGLRRVQPDHAAGHAARDPARREQRDTDDRGEREWHRPRGGLRDQRLDPAVQLDVGHLDQYRGDRRTAAGDQAGRGTDGRHPRPPDAEYQQRAEGRRRYGESEPDGVGERQRAGQHPQEEGHEHRQQGGYAEAVDLQVV